MSEANVKIGPTEREDLSVELRGFEPLTPSMRTRFLMSAEVSGCV
jgi:hypothetical protein